MKRLLLFCSILLFLSGCGSVDDGSIYDTTANPDGFPTMALAVIEGVRDGKLADYKSVTTAFGDLYTENPDLLDQLEWNDVIQRIGDVFRFRADSLAKTGVEGFTGTAEFYQLALLGNPEDKVLQHESNLFAAWLTAEANASIPLAPLLNEDSLTLGDAIIVAGHVLTSGENGQEFFDDRLKQPIIDRLIARDQLASEVVDALSPVERDLATRAGLIR